MIKIFLEVIFYHFFVTHFVYRHNMNYEKPDGTVKTNRGCSEYINFLKERIIHVWIQLW